MNRENNLIESGMPEEVVFTMRHEKRKKMEGTCPASPSRGDFKADSTEIFRLGDWR